MKARQVSALAGVLLVVGALFTVSPAAAKKTAVDLWEVSCQMLDGLPPFPSDAGIHLRGGVSEAVLYAEGPDGAMIVGSDTVVGNLDFDPVTGDGRAFGVFTLIYLPTAGGSPTGTYDGLFDGSLNLFTGSFFGIAVGNGTGDLRHHKMRLRLEAASPPEWLTEYLNDNPPPCGADARFFHDTGFINHPNR